VQNPVPFGGRGDAHLARIDAVNPVLKAVVQVLADEARASAALADDKGSLGVAPNSLIFWK